MTTQPNLPTMHARDKLLIVDIRPVISNQWAAAAMKVINNWTPAESQGVAPHTFYLGISRTKDHAGRLRTP